MHAYKEEESLSFPTSQSHQSRAQNRFQENQSDSGGIATMDSSSLQLESFSFSYRWLISIKDVDDSTATAASFIDIDPRLLSLRWTGGDTRENSNFEKLVSESQDEDAVFLPFEFIVNENGDRLQSPDSSTSRSGSLDSTRVLISLSKRYEFPGPTSATSTPAKSRRSSETAGVKLSVILKKYLCFLIPIFKKAKGMKTSSGKKRRGGTSTDRNRRHRSTVAVVDEGLESSIHEAVLHCKKSIGTNE